MSEDPSQTSRNGKEIMQERRKRRRCYDECMTYAPSGLSIREAPSNTYDSSSDEDDEACRLPSSFSQPPQSTLTSEHILQGESSNARSTPMDAQQQQPNERSTRGRTTDREARRQYDRARRASMTADQVANRRARARERYQNQTPEQRQARRVRRNPHAPVRSVIAGPTYSAETNVTGTNNASDPGSNNLHVNDIVYQNLPESTHVLKHVPDCHHCGAKRFEYESLGFCCRDGKVKIEMPEPPDQLRMLYTRQDPNSQHFLDSTRWFNGHFSFTTFACDYDRNLASARDGVYTFKAHGQIYHNIHSFGQRDENSSHMQLYIYDDDPTLSHRFRKARDELYQARDRYIIASLVDTLRENPYSETFRSLGQVENMDECRVFLNTDYKLDQRTYNQPLTSEVAAVWVEGNELYIHMERGITLFGNDNRFYSIKPHYGCYDPLSYPLFFPRGELGWHPEIPKVGVNHSQIRRPSTTHPDNPDINSQLCVTMREYYCYKFQMRRGIFNTILHGRRLFQQFAVDTYIKLETTRLNYILHNQARIRADLYQGLVDSLFAGEVRARRLGKRWVLPASFIGGGRDMRRRFLDAMALVQKYGKPDFFLTMTCNPNWEEITRELEPGQTPQDRPDVVVKVFKAKLEHLKHQLFREHILGAVVAQVHVIEFQKRGLPHAHFLLVMQSPSKMTSPEQYDTVISAELPNKERYPELRDMVVKHMMHGPCGSLNKRSPCMKDGHCKCHYPRQFQPTTLQGNDAYPIYRRRDNGDTELVRGHDLDNRWVVPYCPKLLRMFDCHMNVEVCSSIKAVKYLYKYIYKGHDRASVSMNDVDGNHEINEIENFREARWVGPQEALWRIYGFDLNGISPPVLQLQLHLPGMHLVPYNENADVRRVLNAQGVEKSMLTEFFKANQTFSWARSLLYREFPEYAVWESRYKKWKGREQRMQVGRIISAHPHEGERYYLRVLLNHVRGPTSYEYLRTVEGIVYPTFREAAEKRGLIEADSSIDECLTEAEVFQMPSSLRRLFATILVFCEPSNVRRLWDKHLEAMSDDFRRGQRDSHEVEQMVLIDIRNILQSMGKDITLYPLPDIHISDDTSGVVREIFEEISVEVDPEDLSIVSSLNREQRQAYNEILESVNSGKGGVFFVDGPGGTGKIFLYKALLARVRSDGNIAIATATSGVAASIMPGGRTAHSRFKIPLNIHDGAVCNFTKQSGTAKLLHHASLILWDEATMTKRQAIEALDKSMRDIMDNPAVPFGGKTFVFGGDFRQVLPVVRKGTRALIINTTLRRSYLWDNMRQLKLVQNMRAQSDPGFSDYLLRIGNGAEETIEEDYIKLPSDICVPYTGGESDINNLIDVVFPMLEANMTNSNYITSRAILSTRNENVDGINMKLIERFPGQEMVYHSFDCAVDDPNNHYPSEFLNSLTPNGLPPHILKLKVNCPVILLRNLDPPNGLCNGTRLVVRAFQRNSIDAEIVLGQHAGKRVFLPRIPLCPSDDEMFPFKFKRKQFPIRVSFAMTINKAQGQTIPHVGIYLPNPVFSHGQLYVAMSRATSKSNLRVLVAMTNDDMKESDDTLTKNIVYKEVLTS